MFLPVYGKLSQNWEQKKFLYGNNLVLTWSGIYRKRLWKRGEKDTGPSELIESRVLLPELLQLTIASTSKASLFNIGLQENKLYPDWAF